MLELESLLDKERQKLGRLRKAHYQIAAELGLIEEVSYFYIVSMFQFWEIFLLIITLKFRLVNTYNETREICDFKKINFNSARGTIF